MGERVCVGQNPRLNSKVSNAAFEKTWKQDVRTQNDAFLTLCLSFKVGKKYGRLRVRLL